MALTGNNSETESDSVPSDHGDGSESNPALFPVWDPRHPDWSSPLSFQLKDLTRDVQVLLEFDLAHFDIADHIHDLMYSSARLLEYLRYLPTMSLEEHHPGLDIISGFSALVHPKILGRLFEYRKLFRRVAHENTSIHRHSTIVTWIDEFIVKLCDLTGILTSGSMESPPPVIETIQTHLNIDAIRAACQLPDDWEDLNNTIGSPFCSPAAKRMALTLMFATYVMGPRLGRDTIIRSEKNDRSPQIYLRPPLKLDSLFDAAKSLCSRVQSPSAVFLQERVAAAMLLSLFPIVDVIEGTQKPTLRPSELRPESLGYLLDLISIVMAKEATCFLPLETLDVAQAILLRWGSIVPWSWSTWTDQRGADTEYICAMTSAWLYHLDRPLFSNLLQSEDDKVVAIDLRQCLLVDSAASCHVLLQLLRNIVARLSQEMDGTMTSNSVVLVMILGRLCWSTVQFLENEIITSNAAVHNRIPEYTKCLLLVFCHLGCSQEELFARDMIIEALTLIPTELMTSCLRAVMQNKSAHFVRKLDQAVRFSASCLSDHETDHEKHSHLLRGAKSLLEFLSLMLNCSEINKSIVGVAQRYMGTVTGLLGEETTYWSMRQQLLLVPLLTILCVSEKLILDQDQEDNVDAEEIWRWSVNSGAGNVLIAVSFAHFLRFSKKLCDPLTCYEAWDLLSSTLTAIVDRRIQEQDEPLALLTCGTVCFALKKLMHSCDEATRQIIRSSPWTASLKTTLDVVADGCLGSVYIERLRTRIREDWSALATELASGDSTDTQATGDVVCIY